MVKNTHIILFSRLVSTDFNSFLTEKPSQIYIETIEDTVYLEFQKKDLLNLYCKSHQLEALGRIIAESLSRDVRNWRTCNYIT